MASMSVEALGIVMGCKEGMEEKVGIVRGVVEQLTKKIQRNTQTMMTDTMVVRIIRVIQRKLRKIGCRNFDKCIDDFKANEPCHNACFEMDRSESTEAATGTDVEASFSESSPCIGWARAIADYVPSPYDKQALSLRRGDLIQVTGRREGGTWDGECGGRRGTFKFINVKMVEEDHSEPT